MLQSFPIVTVPMIVAVSARNARSPMMGMSPFSSFIIAIIRSFNLAKVNESLEKYANQGYETLEHVFAADNALDNDWRVRR
jgi:hypothetical protein